MGQKKSKVQNLTDGIDESFNSFINKYCECKEGLYTDYMELLTAFSVYIFNYDVYLRFRLLNNHFQLFPGDKQFLQNENAQFVYPLWLLQASCCKDFILLLNKYNYISLSLQKEHKIVLGIKIKTFPSIINLNVETNLDNTIFIV